MLTRSVLLRMSYGLTPVERHLLLLEREHESHDHIDLSTVEIEMAATTGEEDDQMLPFVMPPAQAPAETQIVQAS